MNNVIDIHDLPKDDIKLLKSLVSVLRKRKKSHEEKDWNSLAIKSFAKEWENTEDSIYDNWQELYHVSKR
jgi:hypothetical protein